MRTLMDSEQRRAGAPGGSGPSVLHVTPTALGLGAEVIVGALVDELGGAQGGHRVESLFQGQRHIAVDPELGLPSGPVAAEGSRATLTGRELGLERFSLRVAARTGDGPLRRARAGGAA